MRLPAIKVKRPRSQDAVVRSIPAPVGGWNARDSLANMREDEAIRLINWFPRTTYCEIRGGSTNHVTGIATLPKTLVAWNGPTTSKMFASTTTNIYDTTVAGAVGASVAVCTLGKWQWVNYGSVSATHYLIMVNGQDKPFYYDGTTWIAVDGASTPALTGITTTKLVHVNLFKQRLYFLEKDKMNFWYLPVQQVGGALTEFVLDSLATRGGFVQAMATWTIDAGAGVDDHAVFVTSEGEAIVFKGSDPSSSTNWSLVGVYYVGKPIGRNCFAKFGGDLVLLVQDGLFPLSKALLSASIDRSSALTDKINKAFLEAAQLYNGVYGWQAVPYPAQGALIINIPVVEGGTHKQYVMNTVSKAWCEFSTWNAESMIVFGGQLYFATGTSVVKAWTGTSDVGSVNVVGDAKTAFHHFGLMGRQKRFTLFRPLLMVNGSISFNLGINVDYEDTVALDTATYTVPTQAVWDVAVWDVDVWQPDLQVFRDWRTPAAKLGFCGSALLNIATNSLVVQWAANDFAFEAGAVL